MILVIGASGRVGGELLGQFGGGEVLSRLVRGRTPLRVLAQSAAQAAAFEAQGLEAVWGDPARAATLDRAFAGVTKLFLVTPGSAEQVTLQCQAIAAAARAGVEQIVKISDLGAHPDSPIVHARWNWALEEAIRASGVPYTLLRARCFMQTFLLVVAPSVMAEDAVFAPMGGGRVGFVDVRDIAEVAVLALTRPGHANRVYELTGPEELALQDVARLLSEAVQRDVRLVEVASDQARDAMVQSGLPGWFADDLVEVFASAGPGAGLTRTVAEVTGHPARSLAGFLREQRDAFQTAYV